MIPSRELAASTAVNIALQRRAHSSHPFHLHLFLPNSSPSRAAVAATAIPHLQTQHLQRETPTPPSNPSSDFSSTKTQQNINLLNNTFLHDLNPSPRPPPLHPPLLTLPDSKSTLKATENCYSLTPNQQEPQFNIPAALNRHSRISLTHLINIKFPFTTTSTFPTPPSTPSKLEAAAT